MRARSVFMVAATILISANGCAQRGYHYETGDFFTQTPDKRPPVFVKASPQHNTAVAQSPQPCDPQIKRAYEQTILPLEEEAGEMQSNISPDEPVSAFSAQADLSRAIDALKKEEVQACAQAQQLKNGSTP